MSSDEAYSSFLDQANQDTGTSKPSAQTKSGNASVKAVDTDIPATLQKVEQYYVSEADEPFEPVSLKWNGRNMPSESWFSLSPGSPSHLRMFWDYSTDDCRAEQMNSKIS